MLFRKTVRATTIDQFETALGRADRIVVEGDDHLLAYAASRAAGAPPDTASEPDGGPLPSADPFAPFDAAPAPPPTAAPLGGHAPVDASAPPRAPDRRMIARMRTPTQQASASLGAPAPSAAPGRRLRALWLALAALIVVGVGAFTLRQGFRTAPPPTIDRAAPAPVAPGPAPAPSPSVDDGSAGNIAAPMPDAPPPLPAGEAADAVSEAAPGSWPLSGLVWPFVALVALVLMYLLARQAIAGGSNVKLEWKVTEKMSGRIVITKVRGA